MTRRKIILSASLVLICIVGVILTLALTASNKEEDAIHILNEMYNEDFIVAKSTVGNNPFNKNFTLTVRSLNTNALYDFEIKDGAITGDYYAENVNIELNKLIEQRIDGLAMTNAHVEELTEAVSFKEAAIKTIDVLLITNEAVTDDKADEIANLIKKDIGEVSINLDVLVVKDDSDFNGVIAEIETYFQLSTVKLDSFENLDYEHQNFSY
mgnify:FL=1